VQRARGTGRKRAAEGARRVRLGTRGERSKRSDDNAARTSDTGAARTNRPLNAPDADRQLGQIVDGAKPATIADVITTLTAIDGVLAPDDGLKWFNQLYLYVTNKVDVNPPTGGWKDPAWLTRLDVVFAGFYFAAIAASIAGGGDLASSWQALFESRFTAGIDRIQFALAGMNAHINHDLALALLQTDAELNVVPSLTSPEHDDFEQVNGLLEAELPQALTFLATGIVGQAAQDTGKIGRYLAIWDIRAARDLAWSFADTLRPLSGVVRQATLDAQDQITGVLGRSLLL
jgi:hypothetical protein